MSTIPSKHEKRQGLLDPLAVLAILVLILVILALQPLAGNGSNSISGTLGRFGGSAVGATINSNVSFAADQSYWDESCSHGWSSDATCEAILLRAQSCTISAASSYCSEYQAYLQQLLNP